MRVTTLLKRFSSRSLRVPKIFFMVEISMAVSLVSQKGKCLETTHQSGRAAGLTMGPADIRGRINGSSVFENLKVDMGPSRPARAAH